MIVYLDTSVVLRALFGQEPQWSGWSKWDAAWSSELMGVEARRAIDRFRLQTLLDDRGVAEAQQLARQGRDTSALQQQFLAAQRRMGQLRDEVLPFLDLAEKTELFIP